MNIQSKYLHELIPFALAFPVMLAVVAVECVPLKEFESRKFFLPIAHGVIFWTMLNVSYYPIIFLVAHTSYFLFS